MELINREAAINVKAEFLNPNVKRETEEQTIIDRAYAKGWNTCNSQWIENIKSLPSVEIEQKKGKWIISESRYRDCKRYPPPCIRSH